MYSRFWFTFLLIWQILMKNFPLTCKSLHFSLSLSFICVFSHPSNSFSQKKTEEARGTPQAFIAHKKECCQQHVKLKFSSRWQSDSTDLKYAPLLPTFFQQGGTLSEKYHPQEWEDQQDKSQELKKRVGPQPANNSDHYHVRKCLITIETMATVPIKRGTRHRAAEQQQVLPLFPSSCPNHPIYFPSIHRESQP